MAVCKCVYRTGDRATFPYTQSQTELITISERDIHRLDDEVVVRVRADCRQGVEAAELDCEVERERLIDAEIHWRRGRVGEIGEQRAARTDDLGRLADGRRQVAAARRGEPRRRVGQVLRRPISVRELLVAAISVMPKRKRVGNQVYKISSPLALRLNLIYLPLGLVERPTVRVKGLARSHHELNIT